MAAEGMRGRPTARGRAGHASHRPDVPLLLVAGGVQVERIALRALPAASKWVAWVAAAAAAAAQAAEAERELVASAAGGRGGHG